MVHYIYKITCLCGELKGHYYIGKRSAVKEDHKYYGSGAIIKKYYKKYPPQEGLTIKKEILEYNTSKEENAEREKYWVGDLYQTDPLCLNLKAGGICAIGYKPSEETKRKMSESQKGRSSTITEESKKKISESLKGNIPWNKGVPMSEELKEKCKHTMFKKGHKAWNKGIKCPQNTGERHPMYGKHHTDEAREKNRQSHIGLLQDRAKSIVQMDKDGNEINIWHSAVQIQKELGYSSAHIYKCCNGHKKQYKGYTWKYAA